MYEIIFLLDVIKLGFDSMPYPGYSQIGYTYAHTQVLHYELLVSEIERFSILIFMYTALIDLFGYCLEDAFACILIRVLCY